MCLKIDPPDIVCVLCMTVYIDMKSCWGLLALPLQIFYSLSVRISFNLEIFFSNEFCISDFFDVRSSMWILMCICVCAGACKNLPRILRQWYGWKWYSSAKKYISLVRFSPRNTRQKIKWWALKNILTFKLNKTFILILLKTYFGHKKK